MANRFNLKGLDTRSPMTNEARVFNKPSELVP